MIINSTFRILNRTLKLLPKATDNIQSIQIHCGICSRYARHTSKPNNKTSPAIASKYQVITEDNASVIENTAEEVSIQDKYSITSDEYDGINLSRKLVSKK